MSEISSTDSQWLFNGKVSTISRPICFFLPLSGSPKRYKAILPMVINTKARKIFPF